MSSSDVVSFSNSKIWKYNGNKNFTAANKIFMEKFFDRSANFLNPYYRITALPRISSFVFIFLEPQPGFPRCLRTQHID